MPQTTVQIATVRAVTDRQTLVVL